jgi:hypothetical protein
MMRLLKIRSSEDAAVRLRLGPEVQSSRAEGEEGWALLGLILALAILGMAISSTVIPNVQFQVQRDKEAELIYRGNVMAEAIARYYNLGNRGAPVQLATPMPYGPLAELKRLRDGVTIGVNEIRFIRGSALIDPMTGVEWEPVRARDPRIMKVLQAYAQVNQVPIPVQLMDIAISNRPSAFGPGGSTSFPSGNSPNSTRTPGASGENNQEGDEDEDDDDEEGDEDEDDDDEDEPDEIDSTSTNDPLAHFLQGGATNLPIVGVAPKLKGPAVRTLYGLTEYDDWVFIYIPPPGSRTNALPRR